MRKYELTVVLSTGATSAKKKATEEKLGKVVTELKGKMEKSQDLGERGPGIYLSYPLELEASKVKEFKNKLGSEKDITRYLLVRKEQV